jgi:CubicO group peptidase (beta-lactamase class C family)
MSQSSGSQSPGNQSPGNQSPGSRPPAMEPIFDRTPHPFGGGPVDPVVYDASVAALRQRTVNFAARRYADMMMVGGLDRVTADRHFRLRAAVVPAGLDARPIGLTIQSEAAAAHAAGDFNIETDAADSRVTVRWGDRVGHAVSRPGYGSILLRPGIAPGFDPQPISRHFPHAGQPWPIGDAVETGAAPPATFADASDAFFAGSPGAYGVLVAAPDRVLAERYSDFGRADRATPSWSMTKAITCTVIGRMIHDGWLRSVYDPAPAPVWTDERAIHRLITLDHLLRMRSGLGFPVRHEDGRTTIGFENSAVYQDAGDAFEAAQRSLVATIPGSVFRYVNSGMNVLGAVIRDQIERRGLPYFETAYGLLVDRIGMSGYQYSADLAGNLIASGAGYATLRDYAKLGVLYLNDGIWNQERLLPEGWVDYALTPTHTGTSYAACFRTNFDRAFPSLPPDTAWAAGASDQKIFILRRHRLTVAVSNETDHAMDMAALDRLIATAMDCYS